MRPHIDIIVMRDPDGPTEVYVYVDGKGQTGEEPFDIAITSFDPGAGYDISDWNDQRDEAVQRVHPGLVEQVREWYDEIGEDSKYIEDADF